LVQVTDSHIIVYDKLDRVVATGPAYSPFSDFLKPNNLGWMVTKYDTFNRPVLTAWMPATTVTSTDRINLQNGRNAETTNFNETKASSSTTINGVLFGYTNVVWPTNLTAAAPNPASIYHVLTVNYYDNYNIPASIPTITMVLGQPVVYNNTTTKPIGLPTGSWTRVLETSTLYKNEFSYTLYDHKARPILNNTTNFLGGSNQVETFLDFSGKTLYTVTTHKRLSNSTAVTVREDFTYSEQNRLLTHTHSVNGATPAQLLASNTYDDLGQLISKNVGNTSSAPLQKVDYSYNIRGWMTSINNVNAIGTDLFAFKINYNTASISGVNPLYNGNIAETYWNSTSDPLVPVRAYGYQYDNLNRLKSAVYQKSNVVTNMYNESLTYDKNGNIKTLLRNGNSDATATAMDNLVYTYGAVAGNTNNQLLRVDDSSLKTAGFIDGSNSIDDYSYDDNGNMLKDLNKGIKGPGSADGITYNHLNLPSKIIFETGGTTTGNIVYLYNAVGQKVQKIVSQLTPTSTTTTTDYLGGFQYSGVGTFRTLRFFPTAEGYAEPNGSSYKYVYQYKDHLGNVRLSYTNSGTNTAPALQILEENNYYPFGLKQIGYNVLVNSTNVALKYRFNGQEYQDELGLNWDSFKYRNYDFAIGRFMSIDPLSEKYYYNSPYAFSENRVIDGRELEGLEWASVKNDDGTTTRQLTVQMVNNSSLTDKQVSKVTATMQADFAKNYSGEGSNAKLVVENISSSDGTCDFLVPLVDTKSNTVYDKSTGEVTGTTYAGGQTGELGQTQKNTFEVTATVDGSKRSNSDMSRSFSHEAGHTAGLEHPWSATNTVSDAKQGAAGVKDSTVRSNLMNSDQNTNVGNRSTSGTNLTSGQLKSVDQIVQKQQIQTP
jgi:RHS repeat-associated protein